MQSSRSSFMLMTCNKQAVDCEEHFARAEVANGLRLHEQRVCRKGSD